MISPALAVTLAFLAQAPVELGGIVSFPVDAGVSVMPSSADVTVLNGTYLVAWAAPRGGLLDGTNVSSTEDIWAERIDPAVSPSRSQSFLVCGAPRGSRYAEPKVAASDGEALVVWRDESADGQWSLRGAIVPVDGAPVRGCGRVLAGPFASGLVKHQLAFGAKGYLLTWEEPSALRGRFVSTDLVTLSPVLTLGETVAAGAGPRPQLLGSGVVATSLGYLATWQQPEGAGFSVRANPVIDGGAVYAPDAGASVVVNAGATVLLGRGASEPLLIYPSAADMSLKALLLNPASGGYANGFFSSGALADPQYAVLAAALEARVLAVYKDPNGALRAVLFGPNGFMNTPVEPPVARAFALASRDTDALLVGAGPNGELVAALWKNLAFAGPAVPLGVLPVAQRAPTAAWGGDGWIVAWDTVGLGAQAGARSNVAVLRPDGTFSGLNVIAGARNVRGVLSRPSGLGLLAHTTGGLAPFTSAISGLSRPQVAGGTFLVPGPQPGEEFTGLFERAGAGVHVSLLWSDRLAGADTAVVLPQKVTVNVDGLPGRCTASAAGKLWFTSVRGSELVLWGISDDAAASPTVTSAQKFTLNSAPVGRPCVGASGGRLVLTVETAEGVVAMTYDPAAGTSGDQQLLHGPSEVTLGEPVVAGAPEGWLVVSKARLRMGARLGTNHLLAHVVYPDGTVTDAGTWVSDLASTDEGGAVLSASGGKILLAWERFGDREGVVTRALSILPREVDAGVTDGGGMVDDAGTPDAGGSDADAGLDPGPVTFASCGCSADGGLVLGLALGALALTRRRRR